MFSENIKKALSDSARKGKVEGLKLTMYSSEYLLGVGIAHFFDGHLIEFLVD